MSQWTRSSVLDVWQFEWEGKGVHFMFALAQMEQDSHMESLQPMPWMVQWRPLTPTCPIRQCKNLVCWRKWC